MKNTNNDHIYHFEEILLIIESKAGEIGLDSFFFFEKMNKLVENLAMTEDIFLRVLNLVLNEEHDLTNRNRIFIINKLLVPDQTFILPSDLIYKIVSNINMVCEGSMNNFKKKNQISIKTQNELLHWLVCNLHLFGLDVFTVLTNMIPIFFSYLSYEFLRSCIVHLLFIAFQNKFKIEKDNLRKRISNSNIVKKWYFDYVFDLHVQSPSDDYLKCLILMFVLINAEFKSYYAKKKKNLKISFYVHDVKVLNFLGVYLISKPYENDENDENNNFITSKNSKKNVKEIKKVYERLSNFYSEFKSVLIRNKKRKLNSFKIKQNEFKFQYFKNKNEISMDEISSLKSMIHYINEIFIDQDLFSNSEKKKDPKFSLTMFFLLLQGLIENEPKKSIDNFEYRVFLELTVSKISVLKLSSICDLISDFLSYNANVISFNPVNQLIMDEINIQFSNDIDLLIGQKELLIQKFKLLRYLSISYLGSFHNVFVKRTLEILSEIGKKNFKDFIFCLSSFLDEFFLLTHIWYTEIKKSNDEERIRFFFDFINKSIPFIYHYLFLIDEKNRLDVIILIILMLDLVKSLDISHLNEFSSNDLFLLNIPIIYSFILSHNPLILSKVCDYLLFLKKLDLKDQYLILIQEKIYDCLSSFVFSESTSSLNKSFFFSSHLLSTLDNINLIENYPSFNINTIGNLWNNPALSYITSRIFNTLLPEFDENETANNSGHSTRSLIGQNFTYNDCKLIDKIFNKYGEFGFNGLSNFHFYLKKNKKNC